MIRSLIVVLAAMTLFGCGIASYTTPDGRNVTLTGYDLAETRWGPDVYQITLSESNPYDRVIRTIEDTKFGNTYHEERTIDPAAPARVGLWNSAITGVLSTAGSLFGPEGAAAGAVAGTAIDAASN